MDGLIDLSDLTSVAGVPGHSELRYKPWAPVTQPRLQVKTTNPRTSSPRSGSATSSSTTHTTRSRRRSAVCPAGGGRSECSRHQADRVPNRR